MNFNQLKSIYPSAFLTDDSNNNQNYLTFPYQNQWIHFDKKQLTSSESKLLHLILNKETDIKNPENPQSKWYDFLIENNSILPAESGNYRIIQFNIKKKDTNFNKKLWLNAFKSFFENVEAAFFINDHYGLLIQHYSGYSLNQDETIGILQTLDDDFSIKTKGYIGQYWSISLEIKDIFNEEQTIFFNQLDKSKQVFSLPDIALSYYASEALFKSPIIQQLKEELISHSEIKELITAIWLNQGNISLAAKYLYIHRNTLQYRLDRFYEESGLSLKNRDDLLLCYLLTI